MLDYLPSKTKMKRGALELRNWDVELKIHKSPIPVAMSVSYIKSSHVDKFPAKYTVPQLTVPSRDYPGIILHTMAKLTAST